MRLRPTYRFVIGSSEVNASADISRSTLVRLYVERSLDAPADRLELQLTPAGGVRPEVSMDVAVELGFDGELTPVFSGVITEVDPTITALHVTGRSTIEALLNLRLDQTYEGCTAGAIVSDLARRAGLPTGRIDDGIHFPRYVIDSRKNGARHVHLLAERCSFVTYVLPTGELLFRPFDRPEQTHVFKYGEDILQLTLSTRPELYAEVVVRGESATAAEGADASSWLTKNFQPGRATGGAGKQTLVFSDPAMLTSEAANSRATALLQRHRQRAATGTLRALGRPEVQLGDALRVENAPDERFNTTFQVRALRHWLSRTVGLITELDFWKMP